MIRHTARSSVDPPEPLGRRKTAPGPRAGRGWRRPRLIIASTLALLVLVGLGLATGLDRWWFQRELERARSEVGQRAWGEARPTLEALAVSRRGRGSGEVQYLLGLTEWSSGRHPRAVEAFRRVPVTSAFAPRAAAFEAEHLISQWKFAEAEERLLAVLSAGRGALNPVRTQLVRLGRMEARFEEVRAWLRDSIAEAERPVPLLRELWLLDRGSAPAEGLRENLKQALARSPQDDRVWLGLGRVATLQGRFEDAEGWLGRCLARRPRDQAVGLARLDLARASGRAAEAEGLLEGALGSRFAPSERLAWVAWLTQARASADDERLILECWIDAEPFNPQALERLAALTADARRAVELRRRKAKVDEALDRYPRRLNALERLPRPTASDHAAMGRLSEEAGRPFDARAWCLLATRLDPRSTEAAAVLARLDRCEVRLLAGGAASPGYRLPRSSQTEPATGAVRPASRIEFQDDAEVAGLRFTFDNGESAVRQLPEAMSGGLGLLDYDGDGWLDVYCTQGGAFPPGPTRPAGGDRLFRNRGNGTFEDVTGAARLDTFARGYGHGVAVGDYDNDGRPDLFVTRWRAYALYRNKGDGTFEDATEAAGLVGDRDWPTSAAFADLDGDGDLDLYVCHYLAWDPDNPKLCRDAETRAYVYCGPRDFAARPDHVFRNDGGRFVDVTEEAGIVDKDGRGLGVVAADLDGDGKTDLFVANDQSANFLFRNLGGFRFEEVGHASGVAGNASGGYHAGMGVACGDFDGDGRPDLAVTNFYGESTTLYQNLGGGLFGDRTAASGLAVPSRNLLGFGASFLDADCDGFPDLLTANGHLDRLPGTPYKMPLQILKGDGTRFHVPGRVPALDVPRLGRGLAVGDLDNDGRLDALVLDHKGPLAFLHNRTDGGHFVVFRLEGTRSNRDAVGARVTVTAGGRQQTRWRFGGGSYQSASDARLHFGLGPTTRIDAVEVSWPSGLVQRHENLAADRGYLLIEGAAKPGTLLGFRKN